MDISRQFDATFRVGVLLFDDFPILPFAVIAETFRAANHVSSTPLFDLMCLPVTGGIARSHSGTMVRASAHIGERSDFDALFIVGQGNTVLDPGQRLLDWLNLLSTQNKMIVGVSGGVFAMALAGVLRRKRSVIAEEYLSELVKIESGAFLVDEPYVIDGHIVTTTNIASLNGLLDQLLENLLGKVGSRRVAPFQTGVPASLVRQFDQTSRNEFGTSHPTVRQAISLMRRHIGTPINLKKLSKNVGCGERHLNRLFQLHMKDSAMSYYRTLRLNQAADLLKNQAVNLTEIALMTGFGSSSHFSQSFLSKYGMSPSAFARQQKDEES